MYTSYPLSLLARMRLLAVDKTGTLTYIYLSYIYIYLYIRICGYLYLYIRTYVYIVPPLLALQDARPIYINKFIYI